MSEELISGIVGGIIGGTVATFGAWLTGYWAPKKLEEERERRSEDRLWGKRRALIREMLTMSAGDKGRSFATLKRVTGTPDDDLRRLLVELNARGFSRPDGSEAWIFKSQRPLRNRQTTEVTPPKDCVDDQ